MTKIDGRMRNVFVFVSYHVVQWISELFVCPSVRWAVGTGTVPFCNFKIPMSNGQVHITIPAIVRRFIHWKFISNETTTKHICEKIPFGSKRNKVETVTVSHWHKKLATSFSQTQLIRFIVTQRWMSKCTHTHTTHATLSSITLMLGHISFALGFKWKFTII